MSRYKEDIHTHVSDTLKMEGEAEPRYGVYRGICPIRTAGMGENRRIMVRQEVHSGPKACDGREVILLLNDEDAYTLGLALIKSMPVDFLTAHSEPLRKIVKMLDA